MNIQEIEVTIENDGKVKVHVQGVKGSSCIGITEALEKALGGIIESREETPEYYESEQNDVQVDSKDQLKNKR